ncbi:carbohydrate ABC transporter permease [Paenibacillus alginolyticus]|uniref:Carbohydrate ABC transporter permease n=1 Tax=Paenibacillus alginolyticus TaxID=59839 RepID=A0ABT4GPS6_9BACL|nr:carbohydrate ABC transporter permease [Paenibacillus alginolyticus]MCY9667974.1 carbohydrate ABC transporter permease [Paenibacillus alginolyticus]MCY9698209.1 carbohydrate ABC transporter permease [Paenibacillus alginolyticus]MEC0145506.1 carbohydrate ABC transporter permease [Paenibacillus alginolyticus]
MNRYTKETAVTEILMLVLAAIFMIPIYYLIITTFKTPADAVSHPLGLPVNITFVNYIRAFKAMNYIHVLGNNLIITISSVAGIVMFSAMAAYSLVRRTNHFNRIVFLLFMVGMMVPYQMGILALYKQVAQLGLMNTHTGIVLIEICYSLPFSIFLIKSFISSTVPFELEEAARVDGCGVWRTFWQIVFPLLTPVIATVAILNTLGVWNDFMTPLLFLQSRSKGVLLLEVFRNIGQFSTDWTNFFPMMLLAVAPLILFYIFMQKYIINGITSGSLKG